LIYVDTSALLKLIKFEQGSAEVAALFEEHQDLTSSTLLAVEARRGIMRNKPAALPRVDLLLARLDLVEISDAVIETASRLPDRMLRTLDTIHLATGLLIRGDLDVLLSYDDRLLAAAASHGLPTAAPA